MLHSRNTILGRRGNMSDDKLVLFPFQEDLVDRLWTKKSILIGDDMGLGKTIEAIEIDKRRRRRLAKNALFSGKLRTLVIAPLSVLDVWEREFPKWAGALKIQVIDPKNRHRFLTEDADVYIMHWDALRLMPELAQVKWWHIIADEVHRAKNRKTQQTQALKKLTTIYKTALSGTPAEDKPHDLWSILHWLYPKEFRSYWKFYNRYVLWDTHPSGGYKIIKGVQNVKELQAQIKPFYMRRLKEDVLKDLPDKYYTQIHVDLTPAQRKAYDSMRKTMLAWVGENEDKPLASPVVISRLMRLQQFAISSIDIVDGFKRNKETGEKDPCKIVRMVEPSSKLDALMSIIGDTDESIVVFTQFKQVANLLAARLERAEVTYGLYTGDTDKDDRDTIVSEFQRGLRRIFVGTIRAGGEGITLTRASTVCFIDRDWSPSKNKQAEDRLHRVGQKNAVQVIDLMAKNSVDLGRHQKIEEKWTWLKQLLGDS